MNAILPAWKRCLLQRTLLRRMSTRLVLGIETSCDDTGAAVVDENGSVLGEGYESQLKIHLENGGVIPHFAAHYHSENIEHVVSTALTTSNVSANDLSAIAVTTRPGLRGSLMVGMVHAQMLARQFKKPLIPVHHMEAHALTARLLHPIPFPFLCLLASGGHCQITLVNSVEEFLLLGSSMHNSPGEVLDKIARRLKLSNLAECSKMSGGRAIEYMSHGGDASAFKMPQVLNHLRNCNFSFSGFGSQANVLIEAEEAKYDVPADGVIPTVRDFCASLLHSYAVHMIHRLQRAFLFCGLRDLLPRGARSLVFSGGVACNAFIRDALSEFCSEAGISFFVPPPKLCTDNGVMIAWNGMERLKCNSGILPHNAELTPDSDCSLGRDISDLVQKAEIKVKTPKIKLKCSKLEAVSSLQ